MRSKSRAPWVVGFAALLGDAYQAGVRLAMVLNDVFADVPSRSTTRMPS